MSATGDAATAIGDHAADGATGAAAPVVADGGAVRRTLAAEIAKVSATGRTPKVLDVGGGSGAWAVPLARLGCAVTVVDYSPNALAVLHRRAREAGVAELISPVQGDVDALADVAPDGGADLVLGHGLLEVVDDADAAVAALVAATAPGAALSVLVASRFAAVIARAQSGRLAEATRLLTDVEGRWGHDDPLRRRLDSRTLEALLAGSGGLTVEQIQGDGVLDYWVPGAVGDGGPAAARELAELEAVAVTAEPLRDIATRLHALARRR